jgi:hypothetical protein
MELKKTPPLFVIIIGKKNEKTLFTMAATNNLLCVSFIRKMENLPGVFLKK